MSAINLCVPISVHRLLKILAIHFVGNPTVQLNGGGSLGNSTSKIEVTTTFQLNGGTHNEIVINRSKVEKREPGIENI